MAASTSPAPLALLQQQQQTQPQPKLMKTNPLARRLHKILSTSIDDHATLEALEVLSTFYLPAAGSTPTSPTTTPSAAAPPALGATPPSHAPPHPLSTHSQAANTATARRRLRGDIEARVTQQNRSFLATLEPVLSRLGALEDEMAAITGGVAEMEFQLRKAREDTASLMRQTEELKAESHRTQIRKTVVDAFLRRFTPNSAEMQLLTSPNAVVNDAFFAAMQHLQEIHEDCKALLITEHQRTGLDIMEMVTSCQEKAYDKLFRWTQLELRSMSKDAPEGTLALRSAMRALSLRPALFQTSIDEIAQIRQATMVRHFLDALTRGGPGGLPRPIEMHAHDPLRYVGDMLAWLHQASVSEREMLETLLDVKDPSAPARFDYAIEVAALGTQDRLEDTVFSLLDKSMERTCRPLKARVEDVLASQPGAIPSYRIANLIEFYWNTIARVTGKTSQLGSVLEDLTEKAFKVFFETLHTESAKLAPSIQAPGADLTPPFAVKEAVNQLKDLMSSYDASLVKNVERETDFSEILSAVLDPLLQMCAEGAPNLSAMENSIYVVNCLHMIQNALVLYSFTSGRVQTIEVQIEGQMAILIEELYKTMLVQSGFAPLIAALEGNEGKDTPLSLVPDLDARRLADTTSRLDAFLYTAGFDATARVARLTSSRRVRSALEGAVRRFLGAYGRLYAAVTDPRNRYEFPATLMSRSVEEIETLLEVVGDEEA